MNSAVALVQAYLRVNGYLTVAEFPVVESLRGDHQRTLTDLDILAFRFPGAGVPLTTTGRMTVDPEWHEPDERLGAAGDAADMIIGEVKEGAGRLNRGTRDPVVLRAALVRFGCCSAEEADSVVSRVLRRGNATTLRGHRIRMVVFGSTVDERGSRRFHYIPLGHIGQWLQTHITEHWDILRQSRTKDPALSFLLTLEKARRGLIRLNSIDTDQDG